MQFASVGRLITLITIVSGAAVAAAACGGGSSNSAFHEPGADGSLDVNTGSDTGSLLGNDSGSNGCTPKTCGQFGYTCGQNGDGCGGTLDCGSCTAPEYCGGGGYSKCGGNSGKGPDGGTLGCTPTTCKALGYDCGPTGDGCGGQLNCGSCTMPAYCGGGGFAKCGGSTGKGPDGGNLCTPTTCAKLGYGCGTAADECGGTLDCGTCTAPQTCGGGGVNYQCGGSGSIGPDGGVICTKQGCGSQNCGTVGDGCGGTIACGTCTSPQFCGGGGPNICGGNSGKGPDGGVICTPVTCATAPGGPYNCGQASDGCGNLLDCGTCTDPQFCGGGGYDKCGGNNGLGQDGGTMCTPFTCATAPGGPYNCGQVGDGCGGLTTNCGSCTAPQFCGGGGNNLCGPSDLGGCDSGGTTTVTGYVYDPGNNLPIYNALVYVPSGAVQQPVTGATCGCPAPPAITSTTTKLDGSFTLTNPPSGSSVQIVVQLGKWQITYTENVTACAVNTLSTHLTLPSQHSPGGAWPPNGNLGYGNIPLFAVDTGSVDTMECVLRKMGINDAEFVNPAISGGVPTAPGRVQLYQGDSTMKASGGTNPPAGGAFINGATPIESSLVETASVMNSYDAILFPCKGGEGLYDNTNGYPNALGNLLSYANAGGRVFTTHYSYVWLFENQTGKGGFESTANWDINSTGAGWSATGDYPGFIDQSFSSGSTLAQWLFQPAVGASTTLGQIDVGTVRKDFTSVNAPAQRWMYAQSPNPASFPLHYTFDTPYNETPVCGRVVFSDFHVENSTQANAQQAFPGECAAGGTTLSPQEKLLAFMLFDLTSCVSTPTCTPITCAAYPPGTCGPQSDGCGGVTPDCGTCTPPQTCGGGGVQGQCGFPDGGACSPYTCSTAPGGPYNCGVIGDGCGGVTPSCGTCSGGQQCVGGHCGGGDMCTPVTCATSPGGPYDCGYIGDGCGGPAINCGTCVNSQTCGLGGPNKCGTVDAVACVPETCAQQNLDCGPAGDGCGNVIQCGNCPNGQTCGGGGLGKCGAPDGGSCVPTTCKKEGIACGPADDGCGNLLQCGDCPKGQTCGGGGVSGQCGSIEAGTCTPLTCQQQMINCGPAGDGCGGLIMCGTCTPPASCGGGGMPGQCGGGSQ